MSRGRREGNELFEAASIVLSMMLCGAFSFYLGIDLPSRSEAGSEIDRENSDSDAAGIFSAAATLHAGAPYFGGCKSP